MFKQKCMMIELASDQLEVMRKFARIFTDRNGNMLRGHSYEEVDEYYIERSHVWVQGVTYGVFKFGGTYYTIFGYLLGRLTFKIIEHVLKSMFKEYQKQQKENGEL